MKTGVCFVFVVFFGVSFVPAQTDVTEADLVAASGGRTVRIGSLADGRVTVIPLEAYVSRVLSAEGDPKAADAAQQALAIAIRTYTLKNNGRHTRDGYDLCDTTHCQVLRPSSPTSRRAAMATVSQVLTYRGELAEVFYSASCGGRSERAGDVWPGADHPYLVSRRDEVCEDDPEWQVDISLDRVRQALERVGFDGDRLRDVDVDGHTSSGRVARLRLSGMRPNVIAADQFRLAIGAVELRSTAFKVEKRGNDLRFTGRGYGHGVGMCAIGASRRALRGETAKAILAQYFPGLELTSLAGATVPTPTVPMATDSAKAATEVERLAQRAHDELAKVLGTTVAPITIRQHATLDSFRMATNRPWWVSEVAEGTSIDLAPAVVLAQRGGVNASVRRAVAELLVAGPLAGRPAWVRVGAARYFAEGAARPASSKTRCPTDAELLLAVSATAQHEAESRAEACFARELGKVGDWRAVR